MSFFVNKRALALLLGIILLAQLLISPAFSSTDMHEHACCANDCLICLVANTLSRIRDLSLSALLIISAITLIYVFEAPRFGDRAPIHSSPIALKTKIVS